MRILLTIVTIAALVACGGEEQPTPAKTAPATPKSASPPPVAPAPEATPPTPPAPTVVKPDAEGIVRLAGTDTMQFSANRIEVPADKPVSLELRHIGKLPAAAMGHNVVILQSGQDPMAFAAAAINAKATDYIPEDRKSAVIAHSKVLGGGEKAMIEFTLPGPGTYPFLCSFPGHAAMMKGVLVAE